MIQQPLAAWEGPMHWVVSRVADPQEKAKPIALVPKSNPKAETYAKLIKQVIYKWESEQQPGR